MFSHTREFPTFIRPASERRVAHLVATLAAALLLVVVLARATWTWRAAHDTTADVARTSATVPGLVASVGRRPSHAGRYHAEVVSATPFSAGTRQSWTVGLTRRGHRRVSGARLGVRTSAPETGEVSPIAASVRYVGRGRYRLDDIYFPHPGWWNVALVIDAATGIDSVAFNVVIPAAHMVGAAHAPNAARAATAAY
jgi:hypothetical protein